MIFTYSFGLQLSFRMLIMPTQVITAMQKLGFGSLGKVKPRHAGGQPSGGFYVLEPYFSKGGRFLEHVVGVDDPSRLRKRPSRRPWRAGQRRIDP
jgi:hypothetical protein